MYCPEKSQKVPFHIFLVKNFSAVSTKSNNGRNPFSTIPQQWGNMCDQYLLARHITCDGKKVSLAVNSLSLSL